MTTPAMYRIVVAGQVAARLAPGLARMIITEKPNYSGQTESILLGKLKDQSALLGVLNALHDLRLPIQSVVCVHGGQGN
jgi:hypothetical protein